MKRLFFVLVVLFVSISAFCKDRTLKEMQNVAYSILNKGKSNAKSLAQSTFINKDTITLLDDRQNLSIVGYKEGGYVVMSKDDAQTAVLAYSMSKYDSAHASPEAKWLLQNYEKALQKAQSKGTPITSLLTSTQNKSVEPIVQSHWSQDIPYNLDCPLHKGSRCVTGCVATAAAQILYTLNKDIRFAGYKTYHYADEDNNIQTNSMNIASQYIEWDNLISDYSGRYTAAQGKAVAKLMSICGVIANMKYGGTSIYSTGSGADISVLAKGINNFFHGLKAEEKEFTETEVKKALDAGIPCLYTGYQDYSYGHAFVIDGYDENGYLHCNLGWGGENDGYYLMTDMAGFNLIQSLVVISENNEEKTYTPIQELANKNATIVTSPTTTITSDSKWYVLFDNGESEAIKSINSESLLSSIPYLPLQDVTNKVCSQMVRFVSTSTEGQYKIQLGTGEYIGKNDGNAISTTSTEPGTFKIEKINDNYVELISVNEGGDIPLGISSSALSSCTAPADSISIGSWKIFPVEIDNIPSAYISKIEFNKNIIPLDKNISTTLNYTILPANADNKKLVWSSSNEFIATVDQQGKVTAVSGGTATIYAKSTDGSNVTATCIVSVTPTNIVFEDEKTKQYCVGRWDSDGDGELSDAEAADVTTIDDDPSLITDLENFNEFEFFTSVTSMECTFYTSRNKLKSIKFPRSLQSIGQDTFYNCDYLENITLPESLKSIGDLAFYNCTSLQTVDLPSNLAYINPTSFGGCKNLKTFSISKDNKTYSCKDGILYNKNGDTLVLSPAGKQDIIIPDGVKSIGEWAFMGTYTENVSIPNSVTSIEPCAFRNSHGLKTINIPSSTKLETDANDGWLYQNQFDVYEGESALESITVDSQNPYYTSVDGVLYDKEQTMLFCYPAGKKDVTFNIPNVVKHIWRTNAFGHNKNLRCLTLSEKMTSADYYIDNTYLEEIRLPKSVTEIANDWLTASNYVQRIICNSINPPSNINSMGNGRTKDVYVPASSINSYKQDSFWGKYNIKAIEDVSIREKYVFMTTGSAYQLLYHNSNGTNNTFTSNDENFVEVSNTGLIIAKKAGDAVISIKSSTTNAVDTCHIKIADDYNITFVDDDIKERCVKYYDINKDGEFQFSEALSVRIIEGQIFEREGPRFSYNPTSGDDYKYFCNATCSDYIFYNCYLQDITIPFNVRILSMDVNQYGKLKKFTCLANTPPALDLNGSLPEKDCTLYVPKGTKALYQVADGWKEFYNIEEIICNDGINIKTEGDEPTGIHEIPSVINDNGIYDINGVRTTKPIKGNVYIINGKKIIY